MYSEEYYILLKSFFNHPLEGTLILIGFIIFLYLLYLADKRQEKIKLQELQKRRAQLYNEKEKRYED